MEFKEVKIISIYQTRRLMTIDYDKVICVDLNVDGRDAQYDINSFSKNETVFRFRHSDKYLRLPIKLPMNYDNPKETLDRFFKLLMLQ